MFATYVLPIFIGICIGWMVSVAHTLREIRNHLETVTHAMGDAYGRGGYAARITAALEKRDDERRDPVTRGT